MSWANTMTKNNGKSQFDVWGAAIRTYLLQPSSLFTALHLKALRMKHEIAFKIGFITGVSKTV